MLEADFLPQFSILVSMLQLHYLKGGCNFSAATLIDFNPIACRKIQKFLNPTHFIRSTNY